MDKSVTIINVIMKFVVTFILSKSTYDINKNVFQNEKMCFKMKKCVLDF